MAMSPRGILRTIMWRFPRTNQNAAGEKKIAGTRFVNFKRAALVQALGEHFGKALGHVLHDQNRGQKIRRDLRQDKLQCVRAARGNADGDHASRWKRSACSFFRHGGFLNYRRRKLAASGALGNFYFCNQLVRDFF
jgi:hypothetical protein